MPSLLSSSTASSSLLPESSISTPLFKSSFFALSSWSFVLGYPGMTLAARWFW
jgi:hypothetical protein